MPEWAWQVLSLLIGAGSVYGAIRADLAALRVKADMAASAAHDAHKRIDTFFDRRGMA